MEMISLLAVSVAAAGMVLALPLLRPEFLIFVIVASRTLTDVGAASAGGSLLPSSTLSGAIAILAVMGALVTRGRRVSVTSIGLAFATVGVITLSTLVGILHFGVVSSMLQESLRLVSILAVLIIALRCSSGERKWALVMVPIAISAGILIAGYMAGMPFMVHSGNRAVGTFSHANSAGAFLAVGALVATGRFISNRSRFAGLVALLAAAGVAFSQSLGSVMSLIAGLGAMIILNSSVRTSRKVGLIVLAAVVAGAALVLTDLGERIQSFETMDLSSAISSGESQNSLEWRFINWQLLLAEWARYPWFGFGIGSTSARVMPLGAPPHSMPVQILLEVGLVGTGALIAVTWWAVRRVRATSLSASMKSLLGGLLVLVLVNGSESNLVGYTAAGYLIAAVVGLALNESNMSRAPSVATKAQPARVPVPERAA